MLPHPGSQYGEAVGRPLGGFVFSQIEVAVPPRLQKYFWRALDHAIPDGPAFFLTFVVVFLLIVNGIVAFLRW
jgi:hypothetical protein